jgi:hypothetical protein
MFWREFYELKWPAFYDAMEYASVKDWRAVYFETLSGRSQVVLEIFDREKKIGFAMSAMPATVRYKADDDTYIAQYISASPVRPESIASSENHRLRFCPVSVRERLRPGPPLIDEDMICQAPSPLSYPYTVLGGTEGLVVGRGVELQWKMQENSPFGWWYGDLEALRRDRGEAAVTATVIFRHFPKSSPWYRLDVKFGDSAMRDCIFGGKTGGMRPVNTQEQKRWMQHLPVSPIVF